MKLRFVDTENKQVLVTLKMALATINVKCKYMNVQTQKHYKETLYKLEASFYEVILTLSPLWISFLAPFIIFHFLCPSSPQVVGFFFFLGCIFTCFTLLITFGCSGTSLMPGSSLVASEVAVHRLRIAVASLVAEHRLSLHELLQLWRTDSRAQVPQLQPPGLAARGILPDQESNLGPLNWQVDSDPAYHQGSP